MASTKERPAYRLVARRWASSAFSGEGARLYGGRWNSPGRPLVYLSSARSLCALEMLVHLTTPGSRRKQYASFAIDLPEEAIAPLPDSLPADWQQEPPVASTMRMGDQWFDAASSLALEVPSAIVPEESNYLLNPQHPDFAKLEIAPFRDFRFDERL
ncbi:RES family NAD+ phosphorylase [Roseibacillus ishigakijimensis]|uniref:RES family NAD+ phosphorylase n=1 Tax=Roseibacillus ishigakijimensis TaxID=454146 RepID=A0A934RMX1_9BACT|nr:RES family NAD+ phosphorylase [Roseibacillus ishigakijimensis]MBK1832602.1 RES family NAD+ phosphorylase [Roseibacillus ishigakijimensis]